MPKQNGFSLLQLLTVLALIGILSSLALPSFKQLHARNKATANINELLNQLRFARTFALAQNRHISVCGIGDQKTCGHQWQRGLYVFYDSDADGKIAQAEDIIREFPRNDTAASLTQNGAINANYINFTPQGTSLRKHSGVNIVYCPMAGQAHLGRVIIYFASGRAYLGKDTNGNGIPENGSDKDIEC